ncbi:MAG: homoserine kinase [Bacilli bacterium]|nr:homoserine kinase [Bacilli bacterium]
MKTVRTYATSANLGPGFDCLGVCFDIYNEYDFEVTKSYELVGFDNDFLNPANNLIIKSYEKVFEIKNQKLKYIKLVESQKKIPTSRGLGSSASCIVAGVMIASSVLGDILTKDEIFQISSMIEGHPDNVAPLIYGGLTCSFKNDKYHTIKYNVDDSFKFNVCIPTFELKTVDARRVLPKEVSMNDAVSNIAHTVGIVKAIETGDFELLKLSAIDKLHEPFRFPLIKDSEVVIKYGQVNNVVTLISGAGSTMLLISNQSIDFKHKDWLIKEVKVLKEGAYIYEK